MSFLNYEILILYIRLTFLPFNILLSFIYIFIIFLILYLIFFFFFFFAVLGLELRAYTLNHSTSPFL
jgi:hypothetical protein